MNLKSLLIFALRDLKANKKFTLFFALNLSLGLFGFLALDSFKESIEITMGAKSQAVLGADIGIGARRALSQEEIQKADQVFAGYVDSTSVTETYSMVASADNSRLVELKVIESNYPFYGEIQLEKQGVVSGTSEKNLFSKDSAWFYPETVLQLNLKIGDKVKIGDLDVEVADIIQKDSSSMGSGFSFALPVYLSKATFEKTKLMRFGSTSFQSKLYKLPTGADLDTLSAKASSQFKDPAIQILSHKNSSEQISRLLTRLNDYLGLASLVALFMTALGTTFLYRSHLSKRLRDVAILKSLGQEAKSIEVLYLFQLLFLGVISTLPVFLLCYLAYPLLSSWLQSQLQTELILHVTPRTWALGVISGVLTCLLVCYPMLLSLRQVKPRQLFQGIDFQTPSLSWGQSLTYLPAFFFFWGLSVWLAKSWYVSALFIGIFVTSFTLLALVASFLLSQIHRLQVSNLYWRLPLRNLGRQKFSNISIFLAIALGSLFMNLIPQVQSSLKKEIESPTGTKVPGLFLIDIQEDQVSAIENTMKQLNSQLLYVSPMIRARLETVNDESFEKADRNQEAFSREEETENRFRNRGFNLSYREGLSDSESLIQGENIAGQFNPSSQSLPWISLEKRFADRLKLKIGDRLKFDVQGVPVEGQVKNLRQIKWTSFQPNFFVLFQPGAIDEAPKTFLAGVSNLPQNEKIKIQNTLVKEFPNVSVIDITRVIERVSEVMDQMSLAISGMALLSIIVGMTLLFSIANQKAVERRKEVNLLKILGGDFRLITALFFIEFLLVTGVAAVMGIILSFGANFIMTYFIFESEVRFDWITPAWLFISTLVLTVIVCWLAIQSVLRQKPRQILSES